MAPLCAPVTLNYDSIRTNAVPCLLRDVFPRKSGFGIGKGDRLHGGGNSPATVVLLVACNSYANI